MSTQLNKKNAARGIFVLGLSALFVSALTGCFGSESGGKKDNSLYTARAILKDTGAAVFAENCASCHGAQAEGSHAPTIAKTDFFLNNRLRTISILLRGNQDTVTINDLCHEGGGMPSWFFDAPVKGSRTLSDLEIAGVLTYLRSVLSDSIATECSWGECTMVARDSVVRDLDTVAVWEVKAMRDTLTPYPDGYVPPVCPER